MSIFTTLNTEKKNIWNFITIITEFATAAFIAKIATLEVRMGYRVALAAVAAVLIVNVLAKLYGLIRNQQ